MLDDAVFFSRNRKKRESFEFFILFSGAVGARRPKKRKITIFSPKAVEESLGDSVGGGPAPVHRRGG